MINELITENNPKSVTSEAFKTLRTNIQFMNKNKKLNTLLVTSSFASEGKTFVASNLAVTFAQTGKNVILIDADMRKGRQHDVFNMPINPGLSNYLSEADLNKNILVEDYIRKTEIDNLSIIVAGNIPQNPSELLISTQMIKLLDKLKTMYDLIVIDGTPCELVTDSIILSRIVDSTVIVASYNETKRNVLERTIKSIQNVDGNLAGVILNKVPITNKKNNYYSDNPNNKMEKIKKNEIEENKNLEKEEKQIVNEVTQENIQESESEENNNNEILEKPDFLKNNDDLYNS